MRIILSIILLFSGLLAYCADTTDAWDKLNSKTDSLIYSIQNKDESRIYPLADEILDMLDEPAFKNNDSWMRTEIYAFLADYKHSINEIDDQYYRFCDFLCKDRRTICIDYHTLNFDFNDIGDNEYRENAINMVNKYKETAKNISFLNLMRAKVMMDFAETIAHKPFKYFALLLINKCFENIIADYLVVSSNEKEELMAVRISSPVQTLKDLKLRYKKLQKSLKSEQWYQQLLILVANYAWFDYDFIKEMEYLLDIFTAKENSLQYDKSLLSWRKLFDLSQLTYDKDNSTSNEHEQFLGGSYFSDILNPDFIDTMKSLLDKSKEKDNSSLQCAESELSWRIGFHMSQHMSEKDYSQTLEFKKLIGDLYYAGTTGSLVAWLLYINNQFYVAPEDTKSNQELRQMVLFIKDNMKDYDFAYWFGYDILARYYDDQEPSFILKKLNCYAKALMYRNHTTDEIILNAKKLLIEYARSQVNDSLLTVKSATHYIMWYRKLRDYAINFTESSKEEEEGINEAYSILISTVSNFDNIDYSRYLSDDELTDFIEFLCILSIKMSKSPQKFSNPVESLERYSLVFTNLGMPLLAMTVKKLQSTIIDSMSEIERAAYCVDVLSSMVLSVENKDLLNCNRRLNNSELEDLAYGVALQLYSAYRNAKNGEAEDINMVEFYWGAYHYICGKHDSNYQIVELIKETYQKLKNKKVI